MKIEDTRSKNIEFFKDIKIGTAFIQKYNGDICMKTENYAIFSDDLHVFINAVDLRDGRLCCLEPDGEVIIIHAKLVLEDA